MKPTRLRKSLILKVFHLGRMREDFRVFVMDSLGFRPFESGKGNSQLVTPIVPAFHHRASD
jgi:hypothetical protein